MENRQKIPVPRHSFLWSLNETSGEILTHVGPTEFTPSANDRIVRSNGRGGFEQAPMESRPFVVASDGEYALLESPVQNMPDDSGPNGTWVPGGNKEKELKLGTIKAIPGPCAFPLWPGQSAEVRPAHKLGANHYLLVEVVGEVDETAPFFPLVAQSAELRRVVIDATEEGDTPPETGAASEPPGRTPPRLRIGDRIVIQGRHTQLFIPPSGIAIVPPIEEIESSQAEDGVSSLPSHAAEELVRLLEQVNEGLTNRQFSVLKNELRHRQDLTSGQRAVMLTELDNAWEERRSARKKGRAGSDRQAGVDPYARRAVVLGPKNFCYLFDADGNPRIVRGPARVFPGPHDTFRYRGSRRRVYDAYELGEDEALLLRIITPTSRKELEKRLPPGTELDRDHYEAGQLLLVRGRPSVFFPFIEAEVLKPDTFDPHVGNDHHNVIIQAIGIDQKSGVYIRDLRTGKVKMVRGETSYMVDPRSEEHVHRRVPRDQWNLWITHTSPHKATGEDVVTPWAISVDIPNNEAVLITSPHGRRSVIGPCTELLEYEEQLTPIKLTGPGADAAFTTCFLPIKGNRFTDLFDVESSDGVEFHLRLSIAGHFEGEPESWFQVEDPFELLIDAIRARVRGAAREQPATELFTDLPALVRDTLFEEEGGDLRFEETGMVVETVDVLDHGIKDPALAEIFTKLQSEAIALKIKDLQARLRLESTRYRDTVDAEEHEIQRTANRRMVETTVAEVKDNQALELEKLAQEGATTEARQAHEKRSAEFERQQQDAAVKAAAVRRIKEAEAQAQAARNIDAPQIERSAALAAIDRDNARTLAEAEAVRLKAIQAELVAALHSAADAEVMKAAAENMNLVSLLGGKSPAELFDQLLRGTPLSRTVRGMLERSPDGGDGDSRKTTEEPKS